MKIDAAAWQQVLENGSNLRAFRKGAVEQCVAGARKWPLRKKPALLISAGALFLLLVVWLAATLSDELVIHNKYREEVTFSLDGQRQTMHSQDVWSTKGSRLGSSLELYSCGWEPIRSDVNGCRWIPYTVYAGDEWDIETIEPAPRIVLRQRRAGLLSKIRNLFAWDEPSPDDGAGTGARDQRLLTAK